MNKEKYIERHKQTAFNITNSIIDSVRNKDITRIGYRVYKDGYIGVAGTIGQKEDSILEQEALANLALQIPYTYALSSNKELHVSYVQDTSSAEEILEDLEEIMSIVKENYSDFIISNKVTIDEEEISLINDKNLVLTYADKQFSVQLIVREQNSTGIMDTAILGRWRQWNKATILKEFDNTLVGYRKEIPLPKEEKMPIIFMGEDQSLILSKLLIELNGNKVGTGASLFKDFMGSQKFSEDFNLYQDSSEESFSCFFDGEGVINPDFKYSLIEKGKLVAAYTDKQTAEKFNMPLTGSSASAYDGVPTLSYPSINVGSSGKTLKELLNGKLGLAIVLASGGDYTPEGKFASPVQLAMLTDGEKFLGRVPEFEISGDLYDMFGKDYIGRSEDKPFSGSNALVINMKLG